MQIKNIIRAISCIAAIVCFNNISSATTITTKCNGNWSDTSTWIGGVVPSGSDSVIISYNVILDQNVTISLPGEIIIDSSGDICGNYTLDCEFIANGPISVGTLIVEGVSVNDAPVNTVGNAIVNGTWIVNVTSCVGCGIACDTIQRCYAPVANFSGQREICVGQTISFTDISTNSPTTWNWSFPGGTPSSSTQQNPKVTYNSSGTYNVSLIASNYFGRDTIKRTAYVIVHPLPSPPVITAIGDTIFCARDSVILSQNETHGFHWSTGAITNNITVKNAGIYIVYFKDSNGCSSSASVRVTVLPLPNVIFRGNTSICVGDTTSLSISGGISYLWNNGSTTSNIVVTPGVNTVYSVMVSNGPCTLDTNIEVAVNPKPKVILIANAYVCFGSSITLKASGASTYLWSDGHSGDSITVSPSENSVYSVKGYNGGCSASDSTAIKVIPTPAINICCDSTISKGQSVQLISNRGNSYLWLPPAGLSCDRCPDPIASPSQTTTYTLTVRTDSGCTSTKYVTIDVSCGDMFVPNAFSPDAAYNKTLYVRGECIAQLYFIIFDRWGNKIFESENPDMGWDGSHNGSPMSTGTYVYYAKATMYDGSTIEKHGDVTLVR